ncbi:peptide deformylase [Candidatus Nomurabacteria bacterium]|nr:peptide deformylase [Candidatus Nomurabacteria bacterium]
MPAQADFNEKTLPVLTVDADEKTLRTQSIEIPVEEISTPQFQDFLQTLYDSMIRHKLPKGWMHTGIAAVQIGILKRVFYAYNVDTDSFDIFINPEITIEGEAQDIKTEGCLSIPEVSGPVRRFKKIRVKYYDENGERQQKRFADWNARVIQHEFDHLQGVLFIDKLEK